MLTASPLLALLEAVLAGVFGWKAVRAVELALLVVFLACYLAYLLVKEYFPKHRDDS